MHTPSRRRFVGAALSAVIASATLLLPIGHAQAADPAHTHLVLGATAGYNYDVLQKAWCPAPRPPWASTRKGWASSPMSRKGIA